MKRIPELYMKSTVITVMFAQISGITVDALSSCPISVPGDAWPRAAVVPVDPGAVPAGLLVAPRVGEAAVLARVGARLAVRSQAPLGPSC